jgi:pilus assembly protein CpaE
MFPFDVVLVGCSRDVRRQLLPELARASAQVQAEYQGVLAVQESVADRGTWEARSGRDQGPLLFIIQPTRERGAKDIRLLTEARPGEPILALLEPGGGQAAVVAALREGANQVALLPLQPDDFHAALDGIARKNQASAAGGQVIAVSGAAGGAGATTLAINLAFELACTQKTPCALADLSLNMGVLASYLDLEPQGTIQDLLHEGERLGSYQVRKALTPVAEGLHVLAGPHKAVVPGAASAEDVLRVVGALRRVTPCVILDVPCTYDDVHFQVLAQADHVVLVAQQSVPSARALKLILEALDGRGARGARTVLLNRYDPEAEGGLTSAALEGILGVAKIRTVAADWDSISRSQNSGRPLMHEAPRSPALRDIRALAASLVGREKTAPTGISGLFRQVRAAFGG